MPEEEKIKDMKSPASKTEVQRIFGMAAQLKAWVPGMQLIYPNIQCLSPHNVVFKDLEQEFQ